MKHLEKVLDNLIQEGIIGNVFVRIGKTGQVLYDTSRGESNAKTLFDMASVTKIVVTTSLALIALDQGKLTLDSSVREYFPTVEKDISIFDMLIHSVGIGHKALDKAGNTYDNIVDYICSIPTDHEIGKVIDYSCPGFIMLGKILEQIYGKRLDIAFNDYIKYPLKMFRSGFLPKERENIVNSNINEDEKGIVNDYNCRFLGGVAGNAGLFSCADDMSKFAEHLINCGEPLYSKETFLYATKDYTVNKLFANEVSHRALGFLYVDGNYEQTGGLFADGCIGHCGHTGQSLFVDYKNDFYVIILSDATISTVRKYGCQHYEEVKKMRHDIHFAIKTDFK